MGLKPGTRLGVFEVLSPLGAGGMGEAYLARDTELKREVAIKALPDPVAQDAERVKRFEREARLLASINHPNIGSIFGLERRDDQTFLILELVPGEALGERLDAGSMSLRDILTAFKQIAQALEAAHAQGIVHRDLKPNNVKITPEGLVKVLDFGLAKPFVAETPRDVSKTKTAPSRMTRDGHILGTSAYMSLEQARGEVLDKRTDIWSFGCCLYEALAGRHPFSGSSISEMLSAVLTAQPDYDALPRAVPRNTRYLLRRCLEKDVKRRLHDIGDARIEIEDILEWEGLGLPDEDEERAPGLSPWIAPSLAFATLFVGWMIGRHSGGSDLDTRLVRRFAIELPPTEPIALGSGPALVLGFRDLGVERVYACPEDRTYTFVLEEPSKLGRISSVSSVDVPEIPITRDAARAGPPTDRFGRTPMLFVEVSVAGGPLPVRVVIGRDTGGDELKVLGLEHAPR